MVSFWRSDCRWYPAMTPQNSHSVFFDIITQLWIIDCIWFGYKYSYSLPLLGCFLLRLSLIILDENCYNTFFRFPDKTLSPGALLMGIHTQYKYKLKTKSLLARSCVDLKDHCQVFVSDFCHLFGYPAPNGLQFLSATNPDDSLNGITIHLLDVIRLVFVAPLRSHETHLLVCVGAWHAFFLARQWKSAYNFSSIPSNKFCGWHWDEQLWYWRLRRRLHTVHPN